MDTGRSAGAGSNATTGDTVVEDSGAATSSVAVDVGGDIVRDSADVGDAVRATGGVAGRDTASGNGAAIVLCAAPHSVREL